MANEFPALVVDATSPQTGGRLYLRDGGCGSTSPTNGPVLYCTLIQAKSQPDIWRCWTSMPLNDKADGFEDFSERPAHSLTGWNA